MYPSDVAKFKKEVLEYRFPRENKLLEQKSASK